MNEESKRMQLTYMPDRRKSLLYCYCSHRRDRASIAQHQHLILQVSQWGANAVGLVNEQNYITDE